MDFGSAEHSSSLSANSENADYAASGMRHFGAVDEPRRAQGSFRALTDFEWNSDAEFRMGIEFSLRDWLKFKGIRYRLSWHSGGSPSPAGIPVSSDWWIQLDAFEASNSCWAAALRAIRSYCLRQRTLFECEQAARADGLILSSSAMRRVHREVVDAAVRGVRAVLLVGPSGSGKEGLARCYHRASGRKGEFVARNCSMFTREFLRSELFGAEVGAYSGCTRRMPGAVERAHGGSLFLDEIGELPSEVQPMLLRFLDRSEYERMGCMETRTADTRIVTATHRDLRQSATRGEFRIDLWYRLSHQVVQVPALRDRYADVIDYLKTRAFSDGVPLLEALTPAALELLAQHAWQGNFRELTNFADRLAAFHLPRKVDADSCAEILGGVSLGGGGAPRVTTPAARSRAAESPLEGGWKASDVPPCGAEVLRAQADGPDLLNVTQLARQAFAEDAGKALPSSWLEVTTYLEKYWKPCMFAELTGAAQRRCLSEVDIGPLARELSVDRGTAQRHVARYFQRFRQHLAE